MRVLLLLLPVSHHCGQEGSSQSNTANTNYCRNGETAVRQRLHSSRTNEINNRDREIGPAQSATVLSDCGRVGGIGYSNGWRDSTGISQTDWTAIGGSRGHLFGHSWGGGRHASRVATDVLGVVAAAAAWSMIH